MLQVGEEVLRPQMQELVVVRLNIQLLFPSGLKSTQP